MKGKGQPEKINLTNQSILRELALEQPLATLAELAKAFQTRTGLQVHGATLCKALKTAGIVRAKPSARPAATSDNPALWLSSSPPPGGIGRALSQLADRCGMGLGQGLVRAGRRARRTRQSPPPGVGRCLLLCGPHRLRLAAVAERLPSLGQRRQNLSPLERPGSV
jgi:hypothetical protein